MGRIAQTPNAVWSDGIHFVRPASTTDTSALRWVVGSHTKAGSVYKHRFASLDEALAGAQDATRRYLKTRPESRAYFTKAPLPAASSIQGPKKQRGRPRKHPLPSVMLEPFATTHFNCCHANPYAQVWICEANPLEMKRPVGKPKAGGRAPDQTPYRHLITQCSVMIGEEVVREPDGKVRIFNTHGAAREFANELYENAPEDEVISWQEGSPVVCRTRFFEVIFAPDESPYRPFYLYQPEFRRPVFMDKTRPLTFADTGRLTTTEHNPQAYLEEQERRRERARALRVPSFSETTLRFRSIWEAEREAYRRDQMRLGVTVL